MQPTTTGDRPRRDRYFMKPSANEPEHSWNVMDGQRWNNWGDTYCVEADVTYEQARQMVDDLNAGRNPYR